MSDQMQFASAITTETDLDDATRALARAIRAQIDAPAFDLVVAFLSPHFARTAIFIADQLRESLQPRVLIGCTCEGVISREREVEDEPAISILAAQMPNVQIHPFALDPENPAQSPSTALRIDSVEGWGNAMNDSVEFKNLIGAPSHARLVILLADPFSTPMDNVLDAFNAFYPGVPVIGGMASGAQHPRGNSLLMNDRVIREGAVGIALAGDFETDIIVSQGCRPIGQTLQVTDARENIILRLENEPAVAQVQKVAEELPPEDRALFRNGLFVGRAITPTPFLSLLKG